MDFKQYRENENKIHDQLYGNLFLLSQFYPTSKDFNAVFKKDMFVKNNKAAFFEVVYYLLHTLNPKLTKEKLTAWPPYDIKRENKFRMEVLKYINELNVIYDNADIPHIMSSHLISPGGIKFTKFVLKLSQLVMYEHIKKSQEENVLYCPKPSKNVNLTKANLNNLKKKVSTIESETSGIMTGFQSFHFDSNEQALSIHEELNKLNDEIRLAKKENETIKEQFNKSYPSYPSWDSVREKFYSLKCQYEALEEVSKLFKDCEDLVSYLNGSEPVLEHDKEKLQLPSEISHIVKNNDELNLTEFFHGLSVLLERKALDFPYPTNYVLCENIEKVEQLRAQHEQVNRNFSESMQELEGMLTKMSDRVKVIVETGNGDETEEVLAIPLSDLTKS